MRIGEISKRENVTDVLYVSSTLPEKAYCSLVPAADRTDQQAQRFNRAVISGFRENGLTVHAISHRTGIDASMLSEVGEDSVCCISSNVKAPFTCLSVAMKSFHYSYAYLSHHPSAIVIADVLNQSVSLGAALAARCLARRSVGIVTDVPGIYSKRGIGSYVNNKIISAFTDYVFLTDAMNDILNPKGKPYTVMEGVYCGAPDNEELMQSGADPFIVLYAGSLHKEFGAEAMVNAMRYITSEKTELHIYGAGNYAAQTEEASKKDRRIKYFGLQDNSVVIKAERRASLLINPRSKNEEFTQYSFPSKTIEYMSTGTPVLMQDLPGMPSEYREYVYLYAGDCGEALAEAIDRISSIPIDDRITRGIRAKEYVIDKKNAASQVSRIICRLALQKKTSCLGDPNVK